MHKGQRRLFHLITIESWHQAFNANLSTEKRALEKNYRQTYLLTYLSTISDASHANGFVTGVETLPMNNQGSFVRRI